MNHIVIDTEKCKGCQLCVQACPLGIIRMSTTVINKKGYTPAEPADPEHRCTACTMCYQVCPDVCITVYKE